MSNDNFKIEIPEVNTDSGLNLCCGNKKIYIQSLRLFVSNMPATLNKMRNVTENNLKDYLISVHSLKGMCDYIGAEETRKTAKQLEDKAGAGDLNGILERNGNFISHTEKIIGSIQAWLNNNSSSIDAMVSPGQNNG